MPTGAPDPAAPPCMRQRDITDTAGARQGEPHRVFEPQSGLARIASILRSCVVINLVGGRVRARASGILRARLLTDQLGVFSRAGGFGLFPRWSPRSRRTAARRRQREHVQPSPFSAPCRGACSACQAAWCGCSSACWPGLSRPGAPRTADVQSSICEYTR